MYFSEVQLIKIEEDFKKIKKLAVQREGSLFEILDTCNQDELICMKFLYAYMPLSDLANYDGKMFLKFVRHALKVRKLVAWKDKIESLTFLNYILQYRINNENVEFYSEAFFEEIYPRIKDKDMYEAAIEVNYWCFEKATYRSTDMRTASPFTTIRNAYGRCGEESVLAVAALRSVGIPARQCYAPRWSHCDDNHAWVEVWIDGKWNFLGASEPENRLNSGWFLLPASKGMVIHNYVFSNFVENELILKKEGHITEVNVTDHYATTRELVVSIVDRDGKPQVGIEVRFEIVNYAEFYPLARVKTNEEGIVKFVTGLGDVVVFAHNDKAYVYKKVDVRITSHVEMVIGDSLFESMPVNIEMVPPSGNVNETTLTKEQEMQQRKRSGVAEKKRKAYEATFLNEDVNQYAKKHVKKYNEKIITFLRDARGNGKEIVAFLEDDETKQFFSYKIALLDILAKKDLTDITSEIMLEHLQHAMPFAKDYEEDIFIDFLLCPRIFFEMIVKYRDFIMKRFTNDQVEEFRKDPRKILFYIQENIKTNNELEYEGLSASPVGALELGVGNELTKKIAYVSVCRTLGIPARMNKTDNSVEYFKDGKWYLPNEWKNTLIVESGKIILLKQNYDNFVYYKNYSVAILEKGVYCTLNYEDMQWQNNQIIYHVKAGRYRIITANRLPEGTVESYLQFVEIGIGETKVVELRTLAKKIKQTEVNIVEQKLLSFNDEIVFLSQLVRKRSAVAWLDVGSEPTEHLLNELMELSDTICKMKTRIILILRGKDEAKDPTLMKTLKKLKRTKIYIQPEGAYLMENVYIEFSIESKRMPLALIIEKELVAVFAMSGYHVGIGELLLSNL